MLISTWTDERIAQLKTDYAEGYSGAQIAHRLGFPTRNAVIGKINRLKLSPPAVLKWKQAPRAPREAKPRMQTSRQRHIPGTNRFYEAVSNPAEIKLRCVEIAQRNLTTQEINLGAECEWIEGSDHLHCGHPVKPRSAYCVPHYHLCWVKPIAPAKAPVFRPYAMGAA